ncbi:hypothetical protein CDS [Bradyrhizobium sp. G22]|nr:hypothetical protein CDS [Bradyrhizobium sp. G22]
MSRAPPPVLHERLLKGDTEASDAQLETRPIVWRVVSG